MPVFPVAKEITGIFPSISIFQIEISDIVGIHHNLHTRKVFKYYVGKFSLTCVSIISTNLDPPTPNLLT